MGPRYRTPDAAQAMIRPMLAGPLPSVTVAGIGPDLIRDLVSCIQAQVPTVQAIYLYGSRVQGRARADSDLDLALLLPAGTHLAISEQLALAGSLAALARCDVDLSQLDPVTSVVHCKEVVTGGLRVFERDAVTAAWFEMMTLSDYARLCEDRRPVVAAYTRDSGAAAP